MTGCLLSSPYAAAPCAPPGALVVTMQMLPSCVFAVEANVLTTQGHEQAEAVLHEAAVRIATLAGLEKEAHTRVVSGMQAAARTLGNAQLGRGSAKVCALPSPYGYAESTSWSCFELVQLQYSSIATVCSSGMAKVCANPKAKARASSQKLTV